MKCEFVDEEMMSFFKSLKFAFTGILRARTRRRKRETKMRRRKKRMRMNRKKQNKRRVRLRKTERSLLKRRRPRQRKSPAVQKWQLLPLLFLLLLQL